MNKKLIGFKINFIKNIGEMSDEKAQMFTKEFAKELPGKNNTPLGLLLTKGVDNTTVKSLFITPTQITYSQDGTGAICNNTYEIKNFFKRICDKLFLNYKCQATCSFAYIIDCDDIKKTSENILKMEYKDENLISGVGIKLLLNSSKLVGEFRYEPYISDNKYFFTCLDCQLVGANDLNEVLKESEVVLNDIFEDLITRIYHKISPVGEAKHE